MNCRPISLLSVPSKVLESCITDSMVKHVRLEIIIFMLLISMSLPKLGLNRVFIITHNCNMEIYKLSMWNLLSPCEFYRFPESF